MCTFITEPRKFKLLAINDLWPDRFQYLQMMSVYCCCVLFVQKYDSPFAIEIVFSTFIAAAFCWFKSMTVPLL